jgi:hypothetical protein
MIRYECLEALAPMMTDHLVTTSQSGQRIEWNHISQHEGNLLLGNMGCAIGVGVGLALALPHRKVIALESDGSVLLSLFNLPTLANLNPKNMTVIVFDNGVYSGTRISQASATSGKSDLTAMAKGAGIEHAVTVSDLESFKIEAEKALNSTQVSFIVCKVEESLRHRETPRPVTDLPENKGNSIPIRPNQCPLHQSNGKHHTSSPACRLSSSAVSGYRRMPCPCTWQGAAVKRCMRGLPSSKWVWVWIGGSSRQTRRWLRCSASMSCHCAP